MHFAVEIGVAGAGDLAAHTGHVEGDRYVVMGGGLEDVPVALAAHRLLAGRGHQDGDEAVAVGAFLTATDLFDDVRHVAGNDDRGVVAGVGGHPGVGQRVVERLGQLARQLLGHVAAGVQDVGLRAGEHGAADVVEIEHLLARPERIDTDAVVLHGVEPMGEFALGGGVKAGIAVAHAVGGDVVAPALGHVLGDLLVGRSGHGMEVGVDDGELLGNCSVDLGNTVHADLPFT